MAISCHAGMGMNIIIPSPNIQKKENLDEIIERMHLNLNRVSTNDIEISVSIGMALYPNEGKTLDELLREADKNMYDIKSRKSRSNNCHHQTAILY